MKYSIKISKLTKSFYDICLEKAIREFRKIDGIRSIYKFGNIDAPGNSDIDLLFVIHPNSKITKELFYTLNNKFNSEEKYILFQHNPLIIGEENIENINYVREFSNLIHLSGESYKFKNIDNKYLKLYMLVDLILYNYPHSFIYKRDLRNRFQDINAFKFIFSLFTEVAAYFGFYENVYCDKEISEIINSNNELRKSYRGNKNEWYEMKVSTFERVIIKVIDDMNNVLRNFLESRYSIEFGFEKKIFVDKIFVKHFKHKIYQLNVLSKSFIFSEQPLVYYAFYADCFKNEFKKAIDMRNEVISKYCDFIDKYAYGKSLYYPWWYGNRSKKIVKHFTCKLYMLYFYGIRSFSS